MINVGFFFLLMFGSNSARFLWKSIPSVVKESQPQVVAAWKLGQRLWTRDYAGVHEALRGFDWSQDVQPLVAAFSGRFFFFPVFSIICNVIRRED